MKEIVLPALNISGQSDLKEIANDPTKLKQLEYMLKTIIVQHDPDLAERFEIDIDKDGKFITIRELDKKKPTTKKKNTKNRSNG